MCHAVLVRSPHAHAKIKTIDVSGALEVSGVLAVMTGADALADGLGPMPHNTNWIGPPDVELRLPDGFDVFTTEHHPLPTAMVRYVGEAVALIVADTAAAAADAAEQVDVEYEILPSVVNARHAMLTDAPQVWPGCPKNLSLTCEVGDELAAERAFGIASHIVKFDGWSHRVTGCPLEPRSVVGEYAPASGQYTLRTTSGAGVIRSRERLAATLNVPIENCRVVFGDMGGNFGTRNAFFPEYALIPWAAKRVGRPVKWTATRTECFLSDYQARDMASEAELALDKDGNFLALRGINTVNLGAYTVFFWPLRKGLSMMQSVYCIPSVYFQGHAVLTNTAPTAVYRSAGRPEAVYIIERLIDLAANTCGFDRVELRRRNLIRPDAMPFTTAVGCTYDSGEYQSAMDNALYHADWAGFPDRKTKASDLGRLRGIGVANYVEITSGIPRERVELTVCDDGYVDFIVGTMSSGQGHETSFPQLLSNWLGIPFECIRFVANDTDRVSEGGGSHSGRSMRLVSIALKEAVDKLIAKGKSVAGQILQSSFEDVVYESGLFSSSNGGSIGVWEVAEAALTMEGLPTDLRGRLESVGDITNRMGGYPYGSHVCEVEVDPETGQVEIVAWTGVDDVGLAVNPLILHGQAHGAVTQGIGQALLEQIHYDPKSAQLLTGSLMDYAIPRADDVPCFKTVLMEVAASSHPMGIRPGGEGGTTPALAVLINAIVDALSDFGVKHVDMPATPHRVWQAIQSVKGTP